MRAVVQRVSEASVTIEGRLCSRIGPGLLVLLGIEGTDQPADGEWLAGKIARLRIFSDSEGHMNCSLSEANGQVLVVSQFTLHASTRKGNRPSFIRAAHPDIALPLYHAFLRHLSELLAQPVAAGEFGAMMQVALVNDGPVTIWIDSRQRE